MVPAWQVVGEFQARPSTQQLLTRVCCSGCLRMPDSAAQCSATASAACKDSSERCASHSVQHSMVHSSSSSSSTNCLSVMVCAVVTRLNMPLPLLFLALHTYRYDAGDMTRFTFPTSFAVANLALAYLEFPGAFDSNGHADALLGSLRWSADWLLAARYAPDAFVAVTWAPGKTVKESHVWWGKPEEVKQAAETRVLKAPKAGADLLGQGAAALAAVSVVFKERDPRYSAKLLEVARGLYNQVTKTGCHHKGSTCIRAYERLCLRHRQCDNSDNVCACVA